MTLRHLTLCAFLLGGIAQDSNSQIPMPPLPATSDPDAALVLSLLGQNLSNRTFSFSTVAEACSGKKVLPLTDDPAHKRVTAAIEKALKTTLAELNQEDSPVRKLSSIDEASKFFEDGIRKHLNEIPGVKCDVPPTPSEYPDLRITDDESKLVFYLNPKLVARGSADSALGTFSFEPKNETLKITDDAVHLLVGIEHDGKERAWTFTGWRLIDLSKLRVRLKAEFQASNADLYQKTELSLPDPAR